MRIKWVMRLLLPIIIISVACLGYAGRPDSEPSGSGTKTPERSEKPGMTPPQLKSKVVVGTVGESLEVETRRYTGHVVACSSVNLVPRISGEVLGVLFKEGEHVKKGDPLYELDPIRYDAAVKNAKAKMAECQAKLDYAENSYNRARNLYEQKAASKDNMENSLSEYEAAEALLEAAEADLATAHDDLANTHIYAPIDGKISVTKYTEGNYVTPNSGTLATIVQTNPLRVVFSLSNRDFLSMFRTEEALKEKAVVRLRLADDSEYEFSGSVELVDNQANRQTDTIQVYVRFDNPEGILVPECTVTVLLSRTDGRLAPAVPPSAVMHDANSAYVYVVAAGDVVERREIALGVNDGEWQIIKAGLKPGERIVVDGMHKTMPGGAVIPVMRG